MGLAQERKHNSPSVAVQNRFSGYHARKEETGMNSSPIELSDAFNLAGPTPRPADSPQFEGLDLRAGFNSDRCGGDFFDGVAIGSRVVFLLTDIAGMQPETGAIASQVQHEFQTRAQVLFEPSGANESEGIAALAHAVNRSLIDAARGVRFAPAFLGCFNLTLGTLTYHNAGRLLAVFHDREGVRVLESGGIPLGLFTHNLYEPAVIAFEPRAKLLLVTKGVTERRRGATRFGSEGVIQSLQKSDTESASSICEAVLKEAYDFGRRRLRVTGLLRLRKRRSSEDLTAVALVRPSHPG
jgi:serine phosphatase RsbU (regulator of sigma subunit)